MTARSLKERVEILEQKVEGLQALPARMDAVESQILQLRGEMRDGFSAIVARLDGHDRRFEGIEARLDKMDGQFKNIDERFDDTKRYMLVLHEEVLERISRLAEGRDGR